MNDAKSRVKLKENIDVLLQQLTPTIKDLGYIKIMDIVRKKIEEDDFL